MKKAVIKFSYPDGCKDCDLLISHDGYSYCPLNNYSGWWYDEVPEKRDDHCPILEDE